LWSLVSEHLVRADEIIGAFPAEQFLILGSNLPGTRGDFVELLGVSVQGASDRIVEFGRARWQHEQAQFTLAAGLLEIGGEPLFSK
jgi:hypothetical protein